MDVNAIPLTQLPLVLRPAFAVSELEPYRAKDFSHAVARYICGESDFRSSIAKVCGVRATQVKPLLVGVYNIAVRFKLAFLKCIKNKADFFSAQKIFYDNGLMPHCAWVYLESDWRNSFYTKICSVPIPDEHEIQKFAEDIIFGKSSVSSVMEGLMRQKLTFIVSSGQSDWDTLRADLRCKALETLYICYPFKTGQHACASIVQSVKNQISKIINHYTFQKRAQLIEEDGEYVNLVSTIDRPDPETGFAMERWLGITHAEFDIFEMRHSLKMFYDQQTDPKRKKFLSIILDPEYQQEFLRTCDVKEKFFNMSDLVATKGDKRSIVSMRRASGLSFQGFNEMVTELRTGIT